jgi:hypothetical protein
MDRYEFWCCLYYGQRATNDVFKTPLSKKPSGETLQVHLA